MRVAYRCLFAAALCLCVAANAEPLGLVLSGGGAKGAYEVGVWQELQAAGLASNITVISGTSVGALNAALFATRPDAAEELWFEKLDEIFTINTNRVAESIQRTLNDVSDAVEISEKTGDNWKGVVSFVLNTSLRAANKYVEIESPEMTEGYMDSSKLATVLDEVLPKEWPLSIPSVYVTAIEKGSEIPAKTWCLNRESAERRSLMIRASTSFPGAFDTVSIDGKVYVDGGWEAKGGNNIPLAPIVEHHPEIKTVIVVYLKDEEHLDKCRRDKNREIADKAGVRLVEVIPSEDIGGSFGGMTALFDTSPETAQRLIELGRKDAEIELRKRGL